MQSGNYKYQLWDFQSMTGTFLGNQEINSRERVLIDDESVITIGATTFIFHAAKRDTE